VTSSRARWAALLAVAIVVAVGVPVGWTLSRPDPDVGSLIALRTPPPVPPPPAGGTPASAAVGEPAASQDAAPVRTLPEVRVRSGLPEAQPGDPVAPVRVRAPSVGIDAAIVPVGVDPVTDGMQIPTDVDTVGWYTPNPAPGAAEGSAVLSGHVDSRAQGRGAFFVLEQLQPGDPITVGLADGTVATYEVAARTRYPKAELPLAEVFTTTGPPRLTLVTCGGAFDSLDRRYEDNVVVVAVPVRT